MKHEKNNRVLCKKLVFFNGSEGSLGIRPTILLCKILKQDNFFIHVRTARREYQLAKGQIISIEDTNIPFQEGCNANGTIPGDA